MRPDGQYCQKGNELYRQVIHIIKAQEIVNSREQIFKIENLEKESHTSCFAEKGKQKGREE